MPEEEYVVGAIYFDFVKAFDIVLRERLLLKCGGILR